MPPGIERGPTPTGFLGVTKSGRLWTAKAGKVTLGRFSSAELAATIRYFASMAFRLGRGEYLANAGIPGDAALDLAGKAGFAPIEEVGSPGPGMPPGEPAEPPSGGTTAAATLPPIMAQRRTRRQATTPCQVCQQHPCVEATTACADCGALYSDWLKADAEVTGPPTTFVTSLGSPASETFVEYARRIKGLA